jgi:hypothetical protein
MLAGGQFHDGKLFYLVLKPEYVSQYPLPQRPAKLPAPGPGGASSGVIQPTATR